MVGPCPTPRESPVNGTSAAVFIRRLKDCPRAGLMIRIRVAAASRGIPPADLAALAERVRRRASIGIATTGCLHPTTSSGGPSRRWQSGMSASGKTPRPAGIRTTVAPQSVHHEDPESADSTARAEQDWLRPLFPPRVRFHGPIAAIEVTMTPSGRRYVGESAPTTTKPRQRSWASAASFPRMANRFEAPSSMRLDPSFISKPSHRPSGVSRMASTSSPLLSR